MTVLSDFPRVGESFLGRYEIQSVLGTGGFARVYRAVQRDLDRDVAIKVMRPAIESDDSTEETLAQIENVERRFRREAKVISKFRSPHTVVVHDYGRTEGGLLYMTLEYVDGDTLSEVIKSEAPLPPARVAHVIRQVLRSLHEAHAFDVLHRDIKPQNIMVFSHLDQRDLVKVLDFGIAKVLEVEEEAAAVQELTSDGTLVGTPRYMSPEQIRGDLLSASSDIYSLGLVAFEALTATKAVPETTTMRIIARHLDPRPIEFPPGTELGEGMRWIVRKMIAKNPADRFTSAKEALQALGQWNPHEPVVVTPGSTETPDDTDDDGPEETEITGPGAQPGSQLDQQHVEEPQVDEPPVDEPHLEEPQVDEPHFPEATEPMQPAELLPELRADAAETNQQAAPAAQFLPTDGESDESDQLFITPARPLWLLPAGIAVAIVLLLLAGIVVASGGDDAPDDEIATESTGEVAADPPEDDFVATEERPADPGTIVAEADEEPVDDEPAEPFGAPDVGFPDRPAVGEADAPERAAPHDESEETADDSAATTREPKQAPRPTPRRKKPKKRHFFSVERTK